MTIQDVINLIIEIPPVFKDVGILAVLLGLIEISPLKLNPWKWLKAFYELPSRMEKLENEFDNDRLFRWRGQILRRADYIRTGEKFSKETWDDTIDTIDRYEEYYENHPTLKKTNGKANAAIAFLKKKYDEVLEENDFLHENTYKICNILHCDDRSVCHFSSDFSGDKS